jgi:hypothetical protein
METIARAAEAPRLHRRKPRRPKGVRAPKRRAFRLDDGDPVEAAHALTGAGLYEYGYRAVHRKRLPNAPATEDKSWYFAFSPRVRAAAVDLSGGAASAMTPTHELMQTIVWEKRFVQCRIDGELFYAYLTDVVRERTRAADATMLRARRRPDVSAHAVRASVQSLNGRPLDVEIAVTNPVRSYDRMIDLVKARRPCLELYVPRDASLEADPNALESHLLDGLTSAAFEGRWIVSPDGAHAQLKSVDEVRCLLEDHRMLAEDELACARGEVASGNVLVAACSETPLSEGSDDRALLTRVEAERDAMLAVVEAEHRDRDATSLVWLIAERIIPSLREQRLRTRAQRLASIRADIRERFEPKRSGLMKRIAAFDRALHARMSDAAAKRAEAESLAQIAAASVRHAEERLERIGEFRRKLDELEAAGARELLFPPGTSLRATIAYEHRRRFGEATA